MPKIKFSLFILIDIGKVVKSESSRNKKKTIRKFPSKESSAMSFELPFNVIQCNGLGSEQVQSKPQTTVPEPSVHCIAVSVHKGKSLILLYLHTTYLQPNWL